MACNSSWAGDRKKFPVIIMSASPAGRSREDSWEFAGTWHGTPMFVLIPLPRAASRARTDPTGADSLKLHAFHAKLCTCVWLDESPHGNVVFSKKLIPSNPAELNMGDSKTRAKSIPPHYDKEISVFFMSHGSNNTLSSPKPPKPSFCV